MILIIDNNCETIEKYIKEFKDLGVNTVGTTENEYTGLISAYTFNAFLIVNSDSLTDPFQICKVLKNEHPKIPLMVLAKNESEEQLDALNIYADNIVLPNVPLKKTVPIIMEYIRICSGRSRTDMIYKSVRVELYSQSVFFCGERFHTSKSEYFLIRYMVNAANTVLLEELKRICFNFSANMSNHAIIELISRINSRAEKLFNKKLISYEGNGKYIIAA